MPQGTPETWILYVYVGYFTFRFKRIKKGNI